jgi:2-polyprenyl-3-methyl-5-hydroxy-6-metoxy-1,4-benzoquinol methylase
MDEWIKKIECKGCISMLNFKTYTKKEMYASTNLDINQSDGITTLPYYTDKNRIKACINEYDKHLTKKQLKNFFEKDAAKFEQDRWRGRPEAIYDFIATKKILEDSLAFLNKKKHIRVLDTGCGTGVWGRELKNFGLEIEYLGVDFSSNMIKKSQGFDKESLQTTNINYILTDVEKLPIRGKKYDLVICNHLLEYVIDPLDFLKQICQILSNDGVIIIVTKNRHAVFWQLVKKISDVVRPNPISFQRYFTAKELRHMIVLAGLKPLDWGGLILRPPTYIGDVNDDIPIGFPKKLSKLLCDFILPSETKFSRRIWLKELFYWHQYFICKKGIGDND